MAQAEWRRLTAKKNAILATDRQPLMRAFRRVN